MKRVASLAVIVAVVFGAGCSKGNFSQRASEGKANVFRYPIFSDPTTLDPAMVQDGDTIDMLQQVYEGLVGWSINNQPEGRLAEKWDVKDGGKTYVFHLRKGAKFFNGREVHSEDFKWSIERSCSKELASPTARDYLNDIVGVSDKLDGKSQEVSGVKIIDPYTLEVDLVGPRPYFLGKLTYLVWAALPKEVVPADKPIDSPDKMVGTGPFKCIQYVPNQITVLEANKDYYLGAPQVDKIERPVIKDSATRLNKFKAGEIDLVQLERQDVPGLQNDAQFKSQLKFYDRPAIFYVGLNPKAEPLFQNRDVRRAIAMAIDSDSIVKSILGGLVTPAHSILPPGVIGHRDAANYIKFDPEGAKKLLASAGFSDPSKIHSLVINTRSDRGDYALVATEVAEQLKKNLGLQVSVQKVDWTTYLKIWDEGKVPFFHMRWMADFLDPQNFLSNMLATYPYGPEDRGINYSNPQFDALCKQADAELDQNKRLKLYAQAEDMVLQDAPWVPIYFQRDAELINPRVHGLRESLFGHLPHTTVHLSQ